MDAINAENIREYYALLREVFDEFDFEHHPERIYNMDETGVPLDPRPPKVVTRKGQKKVRYRSSGNKSQITVIGCANATGQPIPPFIIFAAKQLNDLWMKNEVNGSRYAVSDKGWIDQELFRFWLQEHFVSLMAIALISNQKRSGLPKRITSLFSAFPPTQLTRVNHLTAASSAH